MSNLVSEHQVLKKLDIPDFRHITKNKVILLTSMLDRIDPEVAKKALEQFPEFSSMVKEMVTEEQRIIDKSFEDNKESMKLYYETCRKTLDILNQQLEKDDLTPEERIKIIDSLLSVVEKMGQKDSENKQFLKEICTLFAGTIIGTISVVIVALGASSKINPQESHEEAEAQ